MKSQYQKDQKASRKAKKKAAKPAREKFSAAEAWSLFRSFLKDRGDRITETRRIVLNRVLERDDHFQADDLAADLSRGPNRVSRGTVYRTLALLVRAGLVREIRDHDIHVHYEPIFGRQHHEHMICDKCGQFLEFSDHEIGLHIEQACRDHKFQQRNHRVVIFGLCKKCRDGK